MKRLQLLTYAFLVLALFTFSKCKKDEAQPTELPAATTTGAMTFGCKINGQIFVPKDGNGKSGLNPEYVNLGTGVGGGWFLNIPAINWKSTPIEGVSITTDSLLIQEGTTYQFKTSKGNAKAFYSKTVEYTKLDADAGSLYISKFDQTKHILSGTFSFIGTNVTTGEKVNVTEGRFDIQY
jgi:Family of unknown function (DUF6252)